MSQRRGKLLAAVNQPPASGELVVTLLFPRVLALNYVDSSP